MPDLFKDEETGSYGYKQGDRVVIPAEYDRAEKFSAGLAVVAKDDEYGVIDESGNVILPLGSGSVYTSGGWIHTSKDGVEYLYNNKGELVLQMKDVKHWYYPEENVIRVKKDTGWGCVDLQGNTLLPFCYTALGPVTHGWMSFFDEGKWGWINTKEEIVVEPVFAEVGSWDKEHWWGRKDGVYRLYDFQGRLVVDEGWLKILELSNGTGAVKTATGWKYIDRSFNTILEVSPVYDWVWYFSEGLAPVKKDGLWGYINSEGVEVISPRWDKVEDFSEGLAAVRNSGKWGYINTSGKLVIDYCYWSAGYFKNGRARVIDGWYEWYINPQNEAVTEQVYLDY